MTNLYPIDDSYEIVSIWEPIFEALSVTVFEMVAKHVDFPFKVSNEIRLLSRNFVNTFLLYLGKPVIDQPPPEFLETLQHDDPLIGMWNHAMAHLHELGYAQLFYEWGRQTYRNHDNARDRNPFENISHWTGLLVDWSFEPKLDAWQPLNLPSDVISSLQLATLRTYAKSMKLRLLIERTKNEKRLREWDRYAFEVLYVYTWMSNQIQDTIHRKLWKEISELLSDEQWKIFESWGTQQFEKIGLEHYPRLTRFAQTQD